MMNERRKDGFARTWALLLCTVLLAAGGCKPDAALKKSEVLGRGTAPAGSPPSSEPQNAGGAVPDVTPNGEAVNGPTGSISGVVDFSGKAPAPVLIDTSMDPACGLSGSKDYSEQYVVNAGRMANVFIYVKSGPAAAMNAASTTTQPAVLDQKGCRYVPHVVGVVQGGSVEFLNSDPTMHNIHTMPTAVGNETIDISQGPNAAPQIKQLNKPELMIPVRCNNHPWMNAFINVAPTPFFAVSDASGRFSISGLPPGNYVLGAVQEKLGEKDMNVSVKANGSSRAEFSFAMAH